MTVRAHRTRCWNRYQSRGGGGGGGKDRCAADGGGEDLPNGNPNKERQLLENGKLIPIMIPSKSLGNTEGRAPFLFYNSVPIRTQRLKNEHEKDSKTDKLWAIIGP